MAANTEDEEEFISQDLHQKIRVALLKVSDDFKLDPASFSILLAMLYYDVVNQAGGCPICIFQKVLLENNKPEHLHHKSAPDPSNLN